jgi:SAM-dependent methyltransferase
MSLSYFLHQAREFGADYTIGVLVRQRLGLTVREFPMVRELIRGKHGLELGGPSSSFRRGGILPVYDYIGSIDNCTFAPYCSWRRDNAPFHYSPDRPPGQQFLTDVVDLSGLADRSYDFVLSSHMIEHTANPLGAMAAWKRVLKPAGVLILLVPDKKRTFDNYRATTTMDHLIVDHKVNRGEDDLTHLEEMLRDHNMKRTSDWSRERLEALVRNNAQTRGMHHHVFDLPLLRRMMDYIGFEPLVLRRALPNHLVAVGRKP